MTFDNCLDCPVPIGRLLLTFAVSLCALLAGTFLITRPRAGVQAFGAILLAPTLLWYASSAWILPRWGISWQANRPARNATLDRMVIYSWLTVSFAIAGVLWVRLRRRA